MKVNRLLHVFWHHGRGEWVPRLLTETGLTQTATTGLVRMGYLDTHVLKDGSLRIYTITEAGKRAAGAVPEQKNRRRLTVNAERATA